MEAIIVLLIGMTISITYLILDIKQRRKKQKRQDVLANGKAAERIGKGRLKVAEETGVVYEFDTDLWIQEIYT